MCKVWHALFLMFTICDGLIRKIIPFIHIILSMCVYDVPMLTCLQLGGQKGVAPWHHSGSTHINPEAYWIWTSAGVREILCRVSPHRCLISTQPDADSCGATSTPHLYDLSEDQFVELDAVFMYECDDGTQIAMQCDLDGEWAVTEIRPEVRSMAKVMISQ